MPRKKLSLRERRITQSRGSREAGEGRTSRSDDEMSLSETLDRVLTRGIVAQAEVVLTVAEIPLVYVGLQALVSSVETAAACLDPATRD
ncbi:MAG: gas vesicle protein [Planctomycetota bacterium]